LAGGKVGTLAHFSCYRVTTAFFVAKVRYCLIIKGNFAKAKVRNEIAKYKFILPKFRQTLGESKMAKQLYETNETA
jgi:hypothetical protein